MFFSSIKYFIASSSHNFLIQASVFVHFCSFCFCTFLLIPLADVEPEASPGEVFFPQSLSKLLAERGSKHSPPDASHTSPNCSAPWELGGCRHSPPPTQLSRQVPVCSAPAPPSAAASGLGWAGTPPGSLLCLHGDERRGGAAEGAAGFSPAGSSSAPWCPVSPTLDFMKV